MLTKGIGGAIAEHLIDGALQRAIDKTPPSQFPRTAYGLRAMLLSEGIIVLPVQKGVDSV